MSVSISFAVLIEIAIGRVRFVLWSVAVIVIVTLLESHGTDAPRSSMDSQKHANCESPSGVHFGAVLGIIFSPCP